MDNIYYNNIIFISVTTANERNSYTSYHDHDGTRTPTSTKPDKSQSVLKNRSLAQENRGLSFTTKFSAAAPVYSAALPLPIRQEKSTIPPLYSSRLGGIIKQFCKMIANIC